MRTSRILLLLPLAALATTALTTNSSAHPAPNPTTASHSPTARTGPTAGDCAAGQFCLWPESGFRGVRRTYELSGTDIESCVPLPASQGGNAFANRTGRPVTTYQSAECAETAEFDTYPGGGTWVPQSPYQVRAFKVWER
ncbi:peptidase inhibitor family I36 protein [Streptomyces sp. NPDC003077]|uniref:peptidase inhibitor family I36 protein n=1 Tax=Streptomyces sp. NPDC003077 TaxID=3154443 RepID=UPI0033B272FC